MGLMAINFPRTWQMAQSYSNSEKHSIQITFLKPTKDK